MPRIKTRRGKRSSDTYECFIATTKAEEERWNYARETFRSGCCWNPLPWSSSTDLFMRPQIIFHHPPTQPPLYKVLQTGAESVSANLSLYIRVPNKTRTQRIFSIKRQNWFSDNQSKAPRGLRQLLNFMDIAFVHHQPRRPVKY